ncbi:PspC domain-containing protein [Paenibacillus wynnii]|uniref:PspC domain-containing protein n=1 Tax=Paenibacillus wynnii TaxID=268407 RepID=UPI0027931CFE|nr:PspC domain-containing protein [Paenibacillus wynnii]MDQ0194947.1 phage shock protein PspC (stress-responsive transcriptional regulator) [Paenibacillus wynnii]
MRKLYRSQRDKKISGLCGGLADWFGFDATVIRLIALIAAIFSFGSVLFFYFIASILVPKEPIGSFNSGFDFN